MSFSSPLLQLNMTEEDKNKILSLSFNVVNGLCLAYMWYKKMQKDMIQKTLNDQGLWNNDYPIVLVHGYCGCTVDENYFLGGYFHYAFSSVSRYIGNDSEQNPLYIYNIFEADVSPIGSALDRACELYQQIIGEFKMKEICEQQNLTLHQAVYGKDHADSQHQGTFYKMKYLKTTDPVTKKMYAFPCGLPGFNKGEVTKIHFIGHSMGAITVRYLQYLLQHGYFDEIAGTPKIDRSSMVASLTCISGANNGSLVVNNCGLNYDRKLNNWILNKNGKMIWAFKMTIFFQNIFKTQNRQLENIKKRFMDNNGDLVYELGFVQGNLFYDMNAETWNWNRLENESRWHHYKRLQQTHFELHHTDISFCDLNPCGIMKLNDITKNNQDTYYFSITNGFQDKNFSKPRDINTIPEKITKKVVGFELDIDQEISLKSQEIKQSQYKRKSRWYEFKQGVLKYLKYLTNPAFSHFTFFQETQTQIDAIQSHLCNVKSATMNNFSSIDYTVNDWVEDNDVCISRRSCEFPRHTSYYRDLFHPVKPWGNISSPILIDFFDEPFYSQEYIKPGVWYYGGIPLSDHLDLCGFPEHLTYIRTFIKEEYRYEIWRLMFIRLRMLKFDEKSNQN